MNCRRSRENVDIFLFVNQIMVMMEEIGDIANAHLIWKIIEKIKMLWSWI